MSEATTLKTRRIKLKRKSSAVPNGDTTITAPEHAESQILPAPEAVENSKKDQETVADEPEAKRPALRAGDGKTCQHEQTTESKQDDAGNSMSSPFTDILAKKLEIIEEERRRLEESAKRKTRGEQPNEQNLCAREKGEARHCGI